MKNEQLENLLAESAEKNKYISFPSGTLYNELIKIMDQTEEIPDMIEQATKVSANPKDAVKSAMLSGINAALKSGKLGEAEKENYIQQKEKLEKALKRERKLTLRFVLKFLLATNKYKDIQKLADF